MKKVYQNKLVNVLTENGFQTDRIEEIKNGKFNQTFLIFIKRSELYNITDNRVVLRIAPKTNSGFLFYEKNMMAQEPKIHKIVREKTDIPIPKIFCYDDSRSTINRDYMIMEYLPGKSMANLNLNEKLQKKIMRETGSYLANLHNSHKKDVYGYLGSHNCMKPADNWQNAFQTMWFKLIEDIYKAGIYTNSEKSLALNALKRNLEYFELDKPASLLHMDIWQQNILIEPETQEITGILDWDRALWGDPGIEFAVLDYCGFNNKYFWQGYGRKPEMTNEFKIKQTFYKLYEIQKYLVIWKLRDIANKDKIKEYKEYSLSLLNKI